MTSVDVPFKTPQKITEAVSHLEQLFIDRYTESDQWYHRTVSEGQRWRNVPVMVPWPPRPPPSRYRNRGRRYHDNRDYRDRHGYYDERRRYSPPPAQRSPPPEHLYPSYEPRVHRHSPYHHSSHVSPPTHHTAPSHHHYSPPSHVSPPTQPEYVEERSVPHFDSPPQRSDSPPLEAPPTPTGGVSTEESDHMISEPDKKVFDIQALGTFGESDDKTPPTESDVTDILSMAHGGLTMSSLKQAHQSAPTHSGKHKRGEKLLNKSTAKDKPSSSAFQVSHGQSVDVSSSMVFKPKNQSDRRRKRPIREELESSDSDIDVVGFRPTDTESFTVSYSRSLASDALNQNTAEPQVSFAATSLTSAAEYQSSFHSNKPSSFAPLTSRKSAMSVLSESWGKDSQSDCTIAQRISDDSDDLRSGQMVTTGDGFHADQSSASNQIAAAKKKKKKRKKRKGKDEEMVSMVTVDDGSQLKMKFKLQ